MHILDQIYCNIFVRHYSSLVVLVVELGLPKFKEGRKEGNVLIYNKLLNTIPEEDS